MKGLCSNVRVHRTRSCYIDRFTTFEHVRFSSRPYEKELFSNSDFESPNTPTRDRRHHSTIVNKIPYLLSSGSEMTPKKHSSKKLVPPMIEDRVLDAPSVNSAFPSKIIDYNTDGSLAIALDSSVYVWNDGEVSEVLEASEPIDAICWTDDGLVVSAHGDVELWDPVRAKMKKPYKSHVGRCCAMAFNGRRFASGGKDGNIHILDTKTNITCTIPNAHNGEVTKLAWSTNGSKLASAGADNILHIWGDQLSRSYNFDSVIGGITWVSPNVFATGEMNGSLKVISVNPDEMRYSVNTGTPISGIIFSHKYGYIISHSKDDFNWEIWSNDCKRYGNYRGHYNDILGIVINDREDEVTTISTDETLRIWKMKGNIIESKERFGQEIALRFGIEVSIR